MESNLHFFIKKKNLTSTPKPVTDSRFRIEQSRFCRIVPNFFAQLCHENPELKDLNFQLYPST